jgi:hypothetical protein
MVVIGKDDAKVAIELLRGDMAKVFRYERQANKVILGALQSGR